MTQSTALHLTFDISTHVSQGESCVLYKKTCFLETQNFKILVDSQKLGAEMVITCIMLDSLT